MSFIRGGETITIKRRSKAAKDDYGNYTYTTITVTVKDALIAFGSTSEPIDAERDAIDNSLTAYLPNGTEIHEGDQFIIRGTTWVKNGDPQTYTNPFSGSNFTGGTMISLRKRSG
jgi:hypothetical protein